VRSSRTTLPIESAPHVNVFTNVDLGEVAWPASDRDNIDSRLAALMSVAWCLNVVDQYEITTLTSKAVKSTLLTDPLPPRYHTTDVEAQVTGLFWRAGSRVSRREIPSSFPAADRPMRCTGRKPSPEDVQEGDAVREHGSALRWH